MALHFSQVVTHDQIELFKVYPMKKINGLTPVAFALVMVSGLVQAGPEVTVTFKNDSDFEAEYDVVGSSAYSYGEANPKPPVKVGLRDSKVFKFKGVQSPDVTTVSFQYRIGSKTCKFKTSYLKLPGRNGGPKWNKSAVAGGDARCEAQVTSTSFSNHDWAVEFTMR